MMSEDSKKFGFGITIPITGEILNAKRAAFLKGISHDLFEIAIHGFHHDDFSKLSDIDMKNDLAMAKANFQRYGIDTVGYRAPYLRFSEGHERILEDDAMAYSSSGIIVPDRNSLRHQALLETADVIAYRIYGKSLKVATRSANFINVPVSMPDDEILIDRMQIKDEIVLSELLMDVIDSSVRHCGFAVLQIHPERYKLLREPLKRTVGLLKKNKKTDFVTLSTLANLLKEKKTDNIVYRDVHIVCVTGDLDLMSIWDLW